MRYGLWYLSKTGPKCTWTFDFNTSSERPISKLLENPKINVIGPTELKLYNYCTEVWHVVLEVLNYRNQNTIANRPVAHKA